MQIRPAIAADVSCVLPMVARTCAYHRALAPDPYDFIAEPEQMYDAWLRERAEDARSVFLVAERQERLVAFLVGAVERDLPVYRVRDYGFIHDLWVEEAYRHEGVARQMVMLAIERFAQIGVSQVRLDVAIANAAALQLFQACGFSRSTEYLLLRLEER